MLTGRSGRWPLPIAAALVALGIAALHFLLTWREPFAFDDQGFQYLLARTWARGESLFATWDVLYPIGRYTWYGTLMTIFGEEIWVLRLGGSCLVGATAGVLYSALRRLGGAGLAWGIVLAPMLIAKPHAPTILASASVVSAALFVASAPAISRRALLLLALLAGVLFGWREDSAVLATVVVAVAAVRRGRPAAAGTLGLVVAGLGAGMAGWILVMAVHGESVGGFLGHAAHRVGFLFRRLFAPTLDTIRVPQLREINSPKDIAHLLTPLLIVAPVAAYAAILWREAWRWRRERTVRWLAVAAGLAGAAYLPQFVWERPDLVHFFAHLPVLVLVVAAVATGWPARWRRLTAVLLPAALGAILLARLVEVGGQPTAPYPTPAAAAIGATIRVGSAGLPPWAGLPGAPGETLIVLGFGPGWYVLEDLPAGTRFVSTMPRQLATDPAHLDTLRAELIRPTVRWVIVQRGAVRSGFLPAEMHALLATRYRPAAPRWGGWELWEPL